MENKRKLQQCFRHGILYVGFACCPECKGEDEERDQIGQLAQAFASVLSDDA